MKVLRAFLLSLQCPVIYAVKMATKKIGSEFMKIRYYDSTHTLRVGYHGFFFFDIADGIGCTWQLARSD